MPRVLTIRTSEVPADARDRYLRDLRDRKAAFARANCNFWVFRRSGTEDSFVEFTEARDRETLAAGWRAIGSEWAEPLYVYEEQSLD